MNKHIFGTIKSFGAGLVTATITTIAPDRVGDIVRPNGLVNRDLFLQSGSVLAFHDPERPVATPKSITVLPNRVEATAQFPPNGTSRDADEVYGLIKSNVINNVSIGFRVLTSSPIKGGGVDITSWELLEWSFVSVPANAEAVITARSLKAGRVLSASNAGKLRKAHDAAEMCRSLVAGVLDGNEPDADDERGKRLREIDVLRLRATS